MKTEIQKDIVETFQKLNKGISQFSESEFNMIPYQGSWTAGQVVQHIILAASGYSEVFSGETQKSTRKYDEKVKEIEKLFLNFSIKMDSPASIFPEKKEYSKNDLSIKLLQIESELLNAAEQFDLTLIPVKFQIPGFGEFTIYECIRFALIHTQRHTHQLNTIFQYITKL